MPLYVTESVGTDQILPQMMTQQPNDELVSKGSVSSGVAESNAYFKTSLCQLERVRFLS